MFALFRFNLELSNGFWKNRELIPHHVKAIALYRVVWFDIENTQAMILRLSNQWHIFVLMFFRIGSSRCRY